MKERVMFSRRIVWSFVVLLICAFDARGQTPTLTLPLSPVLASAQTLWVSVEASRAGTVGVLVREGNAPLADPQTFVFEKPDEITRKIGLKRQPRSAISVEFKTSPDTIRRWGASLQPNLIQGRGGFQIETANNASITEPVECNGMVCRVCYTLTAESNVDADSLASPQRTMTHDDFATGQNKKPIVAHFVEWKQDDKDGHPVKQGTYFIQLTTTNAAGSATSESRAFSVPGNPLIPKPGGRCPTP
jgi:hypothetical protein